MKKVLTIVFLFTVFGSVYSQQHSYNYIIKAYCNSIKKSDFQNKSKLEITQEIMQLGIEVRENNTDTINAITANIRKEDSELSHTDLQKLFVKQYLTTLVSECPGYLTVSRLLLDSCPESNPTLQYVTIQVNIFLAANSNLSYDEQFTKASEQTFHSLKELGDQVEKDYVDGMANIELLNDLRLFLLHKSDAYYKAFLISEGIKAYGL